MAESDGISVSNADARRVILLERQRERCRRWYARNIEKEQARARAKRKKSIERYREYSRAYNSDNLPKLAAIARNRRARQKGNGGSHTSEDIRGIFVAQRGKCACCQTKLGSRYHVDHIVAIAKGGANGKRNLQILCAPCNQSKSARDPIDFMRMQGRLL